MPAVTDVMAEHNLTTLGKSPGQESQVPLAGPQTEGDKELLRLVQEASKGSASLQPVEMSLANVGSGGVPEECIWVAIQAQNVELARLLLKNQVNPGAKDTGGITLLHFATFAGHLELVDLLIEHRADVNSRDRHEQTPLFFAPNPKVCERLLSARGDPGARNAKGQTVLHVASCSGLSDTVSWLASQVSPELLEIKDQHGKLASYYARKANMPGAARLMRDLSQLPPRPESALMTEAAAAAACAVAEISSVCVSKAVTLDLNIAARVVEEVVVRSARAHYGA